MNFFEKIYLRPKAPRNDAVKPPPEKGAARFFFLLATYNSKLLTANLLFLLFSLPVITIPAALSGMNRVCMLMVREGACFVWTDFFTEFKASFFKSMPLFLASGLLFAFAYLCFLGGRNSAGVPSFVFFAVTVVFLILGFLISCYSFAMLALLKLANKDILRNAISLIFLEPKADLLLVLLVGGLIALFVGFLPFSAPVVLIGFFSVLSLMTCSIAFGPLKRRIAVNA